MSLQFNLDKIDNYTIILKNMTQAYLILIIFSVLYMLIYDVCRQLAHQKIPT